MTFHTVRPVFAQLGAHWLINNQSNRVRSMRNLNVGWLLALVVIQITTQETRQGCVSESFMSRHLLCLFVCLFFWSFLPLWVFFYYLVCFHVDSLTVQHGTGDADAHKKPILQESYQIKSGHRTFPPNRIGSRDQFQFRLGNKSADNQIIPVHTNRANVSPLWTTRAGFDQDHRRPPRADFSFLICLLNDHKACSFF